METKGKKKKSCCCDEKSKRRGTKHKKSDCDKKSHFDLWVFFLLYRFFFSSRPTRRMLKVTNHGHQRNTQPESWEKKHQTRTNTNCRESIFQANFFVCYQWQGEHHYFMSHSNIPGGAIKYPRTYLRRTIYLCGVFRSKLA